MSNHYQRLMQEKLDGMLDEERAEDLLQYLEEDAEAADENARLESVHDMLTEAPHMRAPERLAATIMARLTQTLQAEAQRQPLSPDVQMALRLGISAVTVATMPVMLAASYLVMNASRKPALLLQAAHRVIAMQVMMIDALVILLEEMEDLIDDDPQMTPVATSLVPVVMIGILDAIEGDVIDQLDIGNIDSPADE